MYSRIHPIAPPSPGSTWTPWLASVLLTAACASNEPTTAGAGPGGTGGVDPSPGAAGETGAPSTPDQGPSGGFVPFQCPSSWGELPEFATLTPEPVLEPLTDAYPPDGRLEGPVWIDGRLFLSEISSSKDEGGSSPSQLLLYEPGVGFSVFSDARSNGLAVDDEGRLLATDHGTGTVDAYDPETGKKLATLAAGYEGSRFNTPNDITIRSDGVLYLSDPAWQCDGSKPGSGGCAHQDEASAYWVDLQGQAHPIESPHPKPNGVALSPDETVLYVGGNGPLTAYQIGSDGAVGQGTPFGAVDKSDGFAVDCAGNLYVATNDAKKGIVVLAPDGEHLGTIDQKATNLAFGGPDRSTLYITTFEHQLLTVEIGVPGFPY